MMHCLTFRNLQHDCHLMVNLAEIRYMTMVPSFIRIDVSALCHASPDADYILLGSEDWERRLWLPPLYRDAVYRVLSREGGIACYRALSAIHELGHCSFAVEFHLAPPTSGNHRARTEMKGDRCPTPSRSAHSPTPSRSAHSLAVCEDMFQVSR